MSNESDIDRNVASTTFGDLLGLVIARRWHVLGGAGIGLLLATAVAFTLPKIYRSEVVLSPAADASAAGGGLLGGELTGIASIIGLGVPGANAPEVKEALAILQSRSFTLDFVDASGLMPVLFEDRWNAEAQRWKGENPADWPSRTETYERFEEIREIAEDKDTGMYVLAIEWRDPELAADWANALAAKINQTMRLRAISEGEQSLRYLDDELKKTALVEIKQSIYGLVEREINRIMLANVRKEYVFNIIDPALASEDDEFVRPQRLVMMLGGFFVGGAAVVFVLLARLAARLKVSP